ncbi:hypothetical protein PBCV1_a419R [Paramecium bursaria Chlorella virus 1]|uniref:Uncharacterized protein n=1 Tax=Paramecium bursaria Chlorella virus 1 TaxID=10506 RepID=Q98471_PBCV1|nr:hypothetical protein PBCV1_a419R [Paramecium bursaria Chlorella virus 1]AAC96787.1 hypothetical protein [Paramecium bursaria Chlorella virus 1]
MRVETPLPQEPHRKPASFTPFISHDFNSSTSGEYNTLSTDFEGADETARGSSNFIFLFSFIMSNLSIRTK